MCCTEIPAPSVLPNQSVIGKLVSNAIVGVTTIMLIMGVQIAISLETSGVNRRRH